MTGRMEGASQQIFPLMRDTGRAIMLTHGNNTHSGNLALRDPIAVEEGHVVCPEDDFRAMRAEYYESLGWDERGVPRAATIQELGLDAILGAAEFERMAGGPPAASARQAGMERTS